MGSSSRSRSLPPNRMRTSSARRRSPPESAPRGRSSRSARRPTPSASLRTSDSAAYPPAASNASCAALKRSMFSVDGFSSSAMRSFSSPGQEVVEAPPREHVGEDGGVVGDGVAAGILRQVPGERRRAGRCRPAGRSAPPSTRSSVVLPAPLRPTRPTFSPGRTCRVTPSTIRFPPTSTTRSRTVSTGTAPGICGRGVDHSRARGTQKSPPSLAWIDANADESSVAPAEARAGGAGSTSVPSSCRSRPASRSCS